MNLQTIITKLSSKKEEPLTINGQLFMLGQVLGPKDAREVIILTRKQGSLVFFDGYPVKVMERYEVFHGIFITILSADKPSSIKLKIELPPGATFAKLGKVERVFGPVPSQLASLVA